MAPSNDRQLGLVPQTLSNAVRSAFQRRDELRYHVARDTWSALKRFASRGIANVEIAELPDVTDAVIEGYIDDRNRVVLAALCQFLDCRTFFEIGTNRGRTAWTVARNNPNCRVYTLDLPDRDSLSQIELNLNESDRDFFVEEWDRGEAYLGTPEEERITTLRGDSASFDFGPYEGMMDFVFVDGAHSYAYVKSDTERALRMLGPQGTIAWDDYPAIPGVYRHLNELALTLDHRLYHVHGTRLVLYSRVDLVRAPAFVGRRRLYAA